MDPKMVAVEQLSLWVKAQDYTCRYFEEEGRNR